MRHFESTIRLFRKVLAPKAIPDVLRGWRLQHCCQFLRHRRPARLLPTTRPLHAAAARASTGHCPHTQGVPSACAVTMRSVLPRSTQSCFARLSDSFTLSRCLLFRRPRRHPAQGPHLDKPLPPSPGRVVACREATPLLLRLMIPLQLAKSSPRALPSQAAIRNFFSITLPLPVTGITPFESVFASSRTNLRNTTRPAVPRMS
ncbi:hypothetical protein HDK77DRAFT_12394 [Phyllosticta capitalensis]